jgi:hypothetical protein
MTVLRHSQVNPVIEGAAEALEAFGDVRFSLDPFNASRMDLLFAPAWGPHAGCVYLVDHWVTAPDAYLPGPEIAYSRSKKQGIRDIFPERDVHVVVSTSGRVGIAGTRLAESAGLQVLPGIRSGSELAAQVAALAGVHA